MKKRLLSLLLCLSLAICLLPLPSYAAVPVYSAELMITHPIHLSEPDTFVLVFGGNCQLDTAYNSEGFQNGVRWRSIQTGNVLSSTDTFVGGQLYEFSVRLVSDTGYVFNPYATKINLNMEPVSLTVHDETHAQATYTFTAGELYIQYVELAGVDAPKVGNTPDNSFVVEHDSYSVSYKWVDVTGDAIISTAEFQAGHEYRFLFDVKAQNGHIFPSNVQVLVNGNAARIVSKTDYMITAAVDFSALVDNTPQHTHSPSAWRTAQVYHYKVCTTCGDLLETVDHEGGHATCKEDGKCSVCGYPYIEATENHTPDTKWTACGNLYHAHLCKVCGAHCDTQDHVPGPAATDDEPQKCTVCGYILAPAKNHVHNLTKNEATEPTCIEPGYIEHYACDGCDYKFSDSEGKEIITFDELTISPLGHKISDDWKSDNDYHWRTCEECSSALDETKMAHEMKDGKCATCGYEAELETDENSESEKESNDGKGDFDWIWIVIVGVACLGVGILIPVVVTKMKKKG